MCFGERILSRFTVHPSIHLFTILSGYFEVLISMEEEHKLVDYDVSCEELAISLETAK